MSIIEVESRRTVPQIEQVEDDGPEEFTPDPDYEGWSDEDVAAEHEKLGKERRRRETLKAAEDTVERAVATFRAASGVLDGTEWREPQGYLDAVQPGETRVFEGDLWQNTSGKPLVHSPAVLPDSWTLIEQDADPVEPDPDDYPEWHVGMELETGDIVSYQGDLYELTGNGHTAHEGWAPSVGGYLWRKL